MGGIVRRYINPGEVVVRESEWHELQRIRRAHDAYLRATRRMRRQQYRLGNPSPEWRDGYKAALTQWAELVVEEGRND